MQAAIAILSVSRSIYNKLSFHCHVIYISKIKVFSIRIRIRIVTLLIIICIMLDGDDKYCSVHTDEIVDL